MFVSNVPYDSSPMTTFVLQKHTSIARMTGTWKQFRVFNLGSNSIQRGESRREDSFLKSVSRCTGKVCLLSSGNHSVIGAFFLDIQIRFLDIST